MSTNIFLDQMAFMSAMGQTTQVRDDKQTALYLRLTAEEFCETLCAANPNRAEQIKWVFGLLEPEIAVAPNADRQEMFDGVLDVLVTTTGIGVSANFPLQEGWDEVLRSNVAKIGPDGKVTRRADGKVLKPDGWTAPDLKTVLAAHGN